MQGATAESSLIGQILDNKFRILRLIGKGGMGEVYEAEHVTLGKRVAIKLMLEKYMGDGEAVARFTREAEAASRIGNPHIIDVSDIGTAPDGRAFVVMELLSGKPLSQVIEQSGPLPPQRALAVMRQVLRAVGAAHAKGIVHRDLKPDNIFLLDQSDQPDFVKLLDFGISKLIDPDLEAAATKLTTTGVVMGTPLYMAPEQAMGVEIDHQADIYACGVILYEMLAGRPPFEGQTYAVLVAKVLTTEAPLLSELRPGLAPKLVAAVHRALEKEPKNRFASADAFAAALPQATSASAFELGQTVGSGPVIPLVHAKAPRRSRALIAAAIAGTLGVAAATTILLVRRDATPTPPAPAAPASPAPAAPTSGTLSVSSEPAGAFIIVDGLSRGKTPGTVSLEEGDHKIRLELEGYEPLETGEKIEAGVKRAIKMGLVPVPARVAEPTNPAPAKVGSPARVKAGTPTKIKTKAGDVAHTGAASPVVEVGPKMTAKTTPPPPPPPVKPEVKSTPPTTGLGAKKNPYDE